MSSSSENNNQTNNNNGHGNVAGFLVKLWKLLENTNDNSIVWADDGRSFIISDPHSFSQSLSKYFKHNNLSSFIRQLNMYGFKKVATIENCGVQTDDLHFYHPNLIRGQADKLELIKRKIPQKNGDTISDLRNVFKDIRSIEEKQNSVNLSLSELKRENEMMWAELHDLRQKHQQQQLYIGNLMKFVLDALEQKHGIKTSDILALKRKNSPLMIEGIDADNGEYPVKRQCYEYTNDSSQPPTQSEDIITQSMQEADLDLDPPLTKDTLTEHITNTDDQIDLLQSSIIEEYDAVDFSDLLNDLDDQSITEVDGKLLLDPPE